MRGLRLISLTLSLERERVPECSVIGKRTIWKCSTHFLGPYVLPRQIEVQEMKHWEIKICASLFLLLLSYSLIHCFILEVEKNTRRVPNGEKSLRGIENRTLKIESNFLPFPIGPRRNFSSSCHLFGTYPLLFEECLYMDILEMEIRECCSPFSRGRRSLYHNFLCS